jgi:hypothetical protein
MYGIRTRFAHCCPHLETSILLIGRIASTSALDLSPSCCVNQPGKAKRPDFAPEKIAYLYGKNGTFNYLENKKNKKIREGESVA